MAYSNKKLISSFKRFFFWSIIGLIGLFSIFLGFDHFFPIDLQRYHDQSIMVLDRQGQPLRFFLSHDDKWRFITYPSDVNPTYLKMLQHYEDKRFYNHIGIDPFAIARACITNIQRGCVVSGASTLTMQTARLLEPRPRTFSNKIIEMIRALQLEWHHSKEEILSMYLTLAPFGSNIEGVRAASWFYFNKDPKSLTPAEAALLVAMPQSPNRFNPLTYPNCAKKARQKILDQPYQDHIITQQEWQEASRTPLPTTKHAIPFIASHFSERLCRQNPHDKHIQTTIDKDLQIVVEKLCRNYLPYLDPRATIAAIIVDHQTSEVLSYVGSADYFNADREGQVDMITAVRSPGSTLKPFIYALAFDEKIIHPLTFIQDTPTHFGDYAPSNFNDRFYGQVTIQEALQASLNIPAVAVLDRLGANRFAYHLQSRGIKLHLPPSQIDYSLPIALGGVGLRFEDLVRLYMALAHDGRVCFLKTKLSDADHCTSTPLVKDLGRIMTHNILVRIPTPDQAVPTAFKGGAKIAYKTGTSYGFRDAWAIGYNARYVVGVWVGKPDGTPHIDHYGYKTAAPLMFRLFDLLPIQPFLANTESYQDSLLSIHQNAALPPAMRFLTIHAKNPKDIGYVTSSKNHPMPKALRITFPVNNTHLPLSFDDDGHIKSIPITIEGGTSPYYWFVNDTPVGQSQHNHALEWTPEGAGFYMISVVDYHNDGSQVKIFIEP